MDSSRPNIKTRFLVPSDTHSHELDYSQCEIEVAIHCGDLTEESKFEEFRSAIKLLQSIKGTLKLVVAGNHNFSLDIPMFRRKVTEVRPPLDPEPVRKEYNEGIHHFTLANGASPKYCPGTGYVFDIANGVDVVIARGPPKGIMDMTYAG
ncbi:hypothetical protein BDV10DRAFT_188877 [Aspergillus recurvatus]